MTSVPRPSGQWSLALLIATTVAAPALAAAADLVTRFGADGPASLAYNGIELLAAKTFPQIFATGPDGKPIKLSPKPRCIWTNNEWRQDWGNLVVVTGFQQDGNTLNLVVTFQNTGSQSVTKIDYKPLKLQFSQRPKGSRWKWGYDVTTEIPDSPGVVTADWGQGKLLVCVEPGSTNLVAEDCARPMTLGFACNFMNSTDNAVLFRTPFQPSLEPGRQWKFRASLRLAASTTPLAQVVGDVYAKFTQVIPFTMNWPDRRPIGALFLARDNTKWKTNPRGWFNDEKVDITSDRGRQLFRERLLKYAETSIAEVRKTGGQGVIVWDIEGDQMPHAITYLGDPRVLPREAPEMDAVADEFFQRFRKAGLKTGVCIRPSKVISDGKGGWMHQQVEDHVGDMSDKIAYAKKRWGCTIFYMDTNVKWPMHGPEDATRGMWQGEAHLLSSSDLRELCRRHPDVLIFPEFGHVGYRSVCGVYTELHGVYEPGGSLPRTSDELRLVYPQACTVVACKGDYLSYWDELRKGVMGGDIHLFRGWFGDADNIFIKHLYEEVDLLRRSSSVQKPGAIETLLQDPEPLVRYTALARLNKLDSGQVATLCHALETEKEWVIKRRIVAALGIAGESSAVPVLAALLKDQSGLSRFAATALGQIGAPATPTLLGLATNKDPRLAEAALIALAQYADPSASPDLLKLTKSPNATIRALAAKALGRRPAPETVARLLAMLDEKDAKCLLAACSSLGQIRERAAIRPLVNLILRSVTELKNNTIREAAGDALEAITGMQYGPAEGKWKKYLESNP